MQHKIAEVTIVKILEILQVDSSWRQGPTQENFKIAEVTIVNLHAILKVNSSWRRALILFKQDPQRFGNDSLAVCRTDARTECKFSGSVLPVASC